MGLLRPKGREFTAPVARGSASETYSIAALTRCGYLVLRPVIDGGRYDLVFEDADGNFWRVQCKMGRYKNGSIEFRASSNHVKGSYRGQADYFAVYCPDFQKVYLVPVDQIKDTWANLRVDAVDKFNSKRVRWAQDYEL